jgi:drug/metabolite transporter (DMT)-like permease
MFESVKSPLLSVFLAFFGYSILNISQAVQKIGLEMRRHSQVRGWLLWASATVASGMSALSVFSAISLGEVSVVGAMAGTGLVSLAVFSRLVMGEPISGRQVASIITIVAGAGLVGAFQISSETSLSYTLLYGGMAGVSFVLVVLWIAIRSGPGRGVVVGAFAGFLGAYSQLFQKLISTELPIGRGASALAASVITNPYTLVWVTLSITSMVILQFAYKYGRAIVIIPSFTAAFIVTPVLGGVIVYNETLLLVQWLGVAMILGGAVVLNAIR